MHLFESALRDFMYVERHSAWSSVTLDNVMPRDIDEAARDRPTVEWAGDVDKLIAVLARHRPGLTAIPVKTGPTGVLVVLGMDPANTALRGRYQEILDEWVVPDPQQVPVEILERAGAVEPEALLASPVWAEIVRGRRCGLSGPDDRTTAGRWVPSGPWSRADPRRTLPSSRATALGA